MGRFARRSLSSAFFVFLVGCSSLGREESMRVDLINLGLGESTAFETTLRAIVRIQNASPTPYLLKGSAHQLYLNGSFVGQGLSSEILEIPGLGEMKQHVTVRLQNLALIRPLLKLEHTPAMSYRIESTLYGSGFGGKRKVKKEGTLNLERFASPNP
jgi:LEA14-like dessication related protein